MQNQVHAVSPVPAVFCFESHEVRTVTIKDDIWFVARDVAAVLGYARPEGAISNHCKHAKSFVSLDLGETPFEGATYNMLMIPERDVYRLIMKSTLPGAEKFEEWVVNEVLPSIRKHGHYNAAPVPMLPQTPMEMFLLAADAIKDLNSRTLQIESQINQTEEMVLETATKLDDFLDTRPLLPHQCHAIQKAVAEKAAAFSEKHGIYVRLLFSSIYGFLKRHFNVNTYSAIPSARFDEALAVTKNLDIHQLPDNIFAKARGGVK